MAWNHHKINLDNCIINGGDYIGRMISMDPRQLHNEICAAAENLRRQCGITDVSINPWFYLMPKKLRRDRRILGVHDLWKLYDSSGEDTDSDDGGGENLTRPSQNFATVPDDLSSRTESGRNNVATFDNAPKKESKSSEVDQSSASQNKSKKKPKNKKSFPSAKKLKLLAEHLPAVNYAKEQEEELHSLYGKDACHIKAKEDWLKINYINTYYNTPYWPCEPLNHRYGFQKLQVEH